MELINPQRSLAWHPLFQVMLAFQKPDASVLDLAGLRTRPERIATTSAKFDLLLNLSEVHRADGTPGGIHGALEYATDLFDRGSVEVLGARFTRLLEAAGADPDCPISRLEILAVAERDTILRVWNDTASDVGHDGKAATLPELVSAQVKRTPDAIAVVFEGREPDLRSARRSGKPTRASFAKAWSGTGCFGRGLCQTLA